MQRSLTKYRIGLGVIGLFTLVILVVVLMQASGMRQDQKTQNAANNIATQLNNYTGFGQTGPVPYTLSEAGITNVPSTISYTRTSRYSYRFCVTYKSTSTDFNASSLAQNVVARGMGAGSSYSANQYYQGSNSSSYLYINPIHHKGINCQYISGYYTGNVNAI
ncbi:MAG TPA: hypothetical protein VNG32_01540 [Candidatus Dormibacteraeota bacterium]|nr:hypothetical protein [Candidatus Dormibacteraeota bacterium]